MKAPYPLPPALARMHDAIEHHQEHHEKGFFLAEQDTTGQARAQPILMYVTPQSLRGEKGPGMQVPDWLGEVLEEGQTTDRLERYARAGVTEYWLIYPNRVEVLRGPQSDGSYAERRTFTEDEAVTSPLFPDLEVRPSELSAP